MGLSPNDRIHSRLIDAVDTVDSSGANGAAVAGIQHTRHPSVESILFHHSREPSLQYFLHPPHVLVPESVPLISDGEADGEEEDFSLTGLPLLDVANSEARRQLLLGLPVSAMNIFDYLLGVVSVAFVGHLGALELASAAVAYSLANVTGFAVVEGLAGAMETLCGQAFGAEQFLQLGLILQRMVLILLVTSVPISILWFRSESILLLFGQDPAIAAMSAKYIVCLVPGLFSAACFIPLAKYMQSQNVMFPLAVISACVLSIHLPINYVCIHVLGWGFQGAAIATSISNFLNLVGMVVYLFVEKTVLQKSWEGFSWSAFTGWTALIVVAVPACLMTCLEWWFFEIVTFMSGWLPNADDSVAAMTICFQTAGLCFMLPLGISTAISVRVSNELGANKPGRARVAVLVSVALSFVIGGILSLILLAFRNQWALIFTTPSETAVIRLVALLMPSLVVSQLSIGLETILSGVLRGSGQQVAGSLVNFFAFYFAALPACYWLAFYMGYGVAGLWWGVMVGVGLQMVTVVALTWVTDWKYQAQRAELLLAPEAAPEYNLF